MYQLYVKMASKADAESYLSALTAPPTITFDRIHHDWYGTPYLPVYAWMFTDSGLKRELEAHINVPFLILRKLTATQALV